MRKVIQLKRTSLNAAISSSQTAGVVVKMFKKLDGTNISPSDIGDIQYATIDGGTSKEEIISFTSITINGDDTVTLIGVVRGLKEVHPYNSGGFSSDHQQGASFVVSDNPQLFASMLFKENDEIITGKYTFTSTERPGLDIEDTTLDPKAFVTKKELDDIALAGAPNASEMQKGVLEVATPTQINSETNIGETGAEMALTPKRFADSKYGPLVRAQATPNMTVAVKAFSISDIAYAGGNTPTITAPSTNPRIDLVVIDKNGLLAVRTGSEAVTPLVPALVAGDLPLAKITLTVGMVSIPNTSIATYELGYRTTSTGITGITASENLFADRYLESSGSNTVRNVVPFNIATGGVNTVNTNLAHNGTRIKAKYFQKQGAVRDFIFFEGGDILTVQNISRIYTQSLNTGETDTAGAPTQIVTMDSLAGQCSDFDACHIGNNKYLSVMSAAVGSSSTNITARICDISSAPTFGTDVNISATLGTTSYSSVSVATLANDKALAVYRNASGQLACRVITATGNTVSTSSEVIISSTNVRYTHAAAQIGTDKVLVSYVGDATVQHNAVVITVSGTTATVNTPTVVEATTGVFYITATRIVDDKVLLIRKNSSGTTHFIACVLSISGNTITKNADLNISATATSNASYNGHIFPAIVSENYAYVCIADNSLTASRFIVLNTSGATLSIQSVQTTSSPNSNNVGIRGVVKSSPFVWRIYGGSTAVADYLGKIFRNTNINLSPDDTWLFASNTAVTSSSEIVPVTTGQRLSGFTGLTPGAVYYKDDNGGITTLSGSIPKIFGVALSSTDILLK